jgi:hypothetical protein
MEERAEYEEEDNAHVLILLKLILHSTARKQNEKQKRKLI